MSMLTYKYIKKRSQFGKQPLFSETQAIMEDSIDTDPKEHKFYILRNPVHKESQATLTQSECHVNTTRVEMTESGINHSEGGWPKDVMYNDEDATTRFRRRVERDDDYVDAVLASYSKFEHFIKQNNAVEMYEQYFKGHTPTEPVERMSVRFNSLFKDAQQRPIACINWTYEDEPRLLVVYCDRRYPITGPVNKNFECGLWNIEMTQAPTDHLNPPTELRVTDTCPVYPKLFFGGLGNGKICLFDIRQSKSPTAESPAHLAHRDPVSAILYIPSRTQTEFFAGSTDGKCMWWDLRNISQPTEEMMMVTTLGINQEPSLDKSHPVSCLFYDRSFPTRFLCGTDDGLLINVNRKGRSHDDKMGNYKQAHTGPVKAASRNSSRMLLTCGDWVTHIWSDEVNTSPIMCGMVQKHQVTDAAWAPNRVSTYMTASAGGVFRVWDILRKAHEPVAKLFMSKNPLQKLKIHDDGRFVAMGDNKGNLFLVTLSESLVDSGEKDKPLMNQIYERETKRERILEARIKEIRMKMRGDDEQVAGAQKPPEVDENELVLQAEKEYKAAVALELRRVNFLSFNPPEGGKAEDDADIRRR